MSLTEKDILSLQPKLSIAHAANFLSITVQAVHKQIKLKNISCPKISNKSYITYSEAKQLFNIPFNPLVIAGQIVKGGTGKTTSIQNIASCVNAYGAKVLMIDADPQGNLSDACGIDPEVHPVLIDILKGDATVQDAVIKVCDGMDIISSRIENVILDNVIVNERMPLNTLYNDLLNQVAEDYDFIFIDCPPTMGQAVTAASLYADIILAPLNPDKFSAKGLKILKQEVETLNKRYKKDISYKVFLNKFSGKTILSDKAVVSLISDPVLEGRILQTTVQFAQEIPNTTDTNRNLFSSLKSSPTRDDFDRLTRELLDITPEQTKKINTDNKSVDLAESETA